MISPQEAYPCILQIFLSEMLFELYLLTCETNLGRVDYSSLGDRILMEMLIEGFYEFAKKGEKRKI